MADMEYTMAVKLFWLSLGVWLLTGGLVAWNGTRVWKARKLQQEWKSLNAHLDLHYETQKLIAEGNRARSGTFIIHRPPEGGCPEGWTYQPGLFTEKDGSRQDACVLTKSADGYSAVDYLLAGETVLMPVTIPIELPPNGRKRI